MIALLRPRSAKGQSNGNSGSGAPVVSRRGTGGLRDLNTRRVTVVLKTPDDSTCKVRGGEVGAGGRKAQKAKSEGGDYCRS